MMFIQLITHLKTIQQAKALMAIEMPNIDFEAIDVYLQEKLDRHSIIRFFDAETIPNELEIEVDGIKYINLFPVTMLQEMVEDYYNARDQKFTEDEISQNLLDYRIKDA